MATKTGGGKIVRAVSPDNKNSDQTTMNKQIHATYTIMPKFQPNAKRGKDSAKSRVYEWMVAVGGGRGDEDKS